MGEHEKTEISCRILNLPRWGSSRPFSPAPGRILATLASRITKQARKRNSTPSIDRRRKCNSSPPPRNRRQLFIAVYSFLFLFLSLFFFSSSSFFFFYIRDLPYRTGNKSSIFSANFYKSDFKNNKILIINLRRDERYTSVD